MAIYITGDTHGDGRALSVSPDEIFVKSLTENDTLIICGDFGFDWDAVHVLKWQSMEKKHTVAFCAGNHENYDILASLPLVEKWGDVVGDFGNNTYWLLNGHMYTIEEKKFFVFGGAASIDKGWRIADEKALNMPRTLWWEEEVPSEDEFEFAKKTLAENNWTFDYFISHTCRPDLKMSVLGTYKCDFYDPTESMINSLEYLIKENNGDWKCSFFGHFHNEVHYDRYHCLYNDIINLTEGSRWRVFPEYEKIVKVKFYENEFDNPHNETVPFIER